MELLASSAKHVLRLSVAMVNETFTIVTLRYVLSCYVTSCQVTNFADDRGCMTLRERNELIM